MFNYSDVKVESGAGRTRLDPVVDLSSEQRHTHERFVRGASCHWIALCPSHDLVGANSFVVVTCDSKKAPTGDRALLPS